METHCYVLVVTYRAAFELSSDVDEVNCTGRFGLVCLHQLIKSLSADESLHSQNVPYK